jgi:hypothetical protein
MNFRKKYREEDFKVTKTRRESPNVMDAVKRHEFIQVPPKVLNNDTRNKMIENEKMSKLFTKERRKQAKNDFMDRTMFNLEKQKINKKKLKDKYYNYNFKPQINQKRINIYSKKLHKNVYKKTFDKPNTNTQNTIGRSDL